MAFLENLVNDEKAIEGLARKLVVDSIRGRSQKGFIVKSTQVTPTSVDGVRGEVTVLANTTGVRDLQDDVITPGAFARAVGDFQTGENVPKVLLSHDHARVAGKVIALEELLPGSYSLPQWHQQNGAGALKAVLKFNLETQEGRDAWSNVRGGFIDQYSISFIPDQAGVEYRDGVRTIKSIETLIEVSPVLMGASPRTATLGSKRGR